MVETKGVRLDDYMISRIRISRTRTTVLDRAKARLTGTLPPSCAVALRTQALAFAESVHMDIFDFQSLDCSAAPTLQSSNTACEIQCRQTISLAHGSTSDQARMNTPADVPAITGWPHGILALLSTQSSAVLLLEVFLSRWIAQRCCQDIVLAKYGI